MEKLVADEQLIIDMFNNGYSLMQIGISQDMSHASVRRILLRRGIDTSARRPKVYRSEKKCNGCGKTKPLEMFVKRSDRRDGRCSRCKECEANRLRGGNKTPSKYGITNDIYLAMVASQNGKCAICGNESLPTKHRGKGKLYIDHDHTTGIVRGLLCARCNTGIGFLKDDCAILQNAIDYLTASKG